MKEDIEYKGYTIKIEPDDSAESPNDWGDKDVFLVGFHRQFSVERNDYDIEICRALDEKPQDIDEQYRERIAKIKHDFFFFGLEAYIHSGVALGLTNKRNFPDRQWDVSSVGIVFVSKKEFPTKAKAREAAQGLVETWNVYLSGDVWNVDILDKDETSIDTCGGYYGYEAAKESAISTIDMLASKDAKNPPMYKKEARAWLSVRVPELLQAFTDDEKLHAKMAQALAVAINHL